ncbi:uncharacterized protein LY79DRAFT_657370 [Colletotrichum navitas]|uniref:Uncharacterized protein n=1 Tax=Colletotrichum navitas TaxID=681940 RepID=A0AAD8V8S6_9PEZI|nr:uncharacterized protein LY79DRAFT_657370 [Colletotrichum navitas]KAK1596031.1 hypothetical protein LY79DRAFT_657370 [Colletotrichum navitas]
MAKPKALSYMLVPTLLRPCLSDINGKVRDELETTTTSDVIHALPLYPDSSHMERYSWPLELRSDFDCQLRTRSTGCLSVLTTNGSGTHPLNPSVHDRLRQHSVTEARTCRFLGCDWRRLSNLTDNHDAASITTDAQFIGRPVTSAQNGTRPPYLAELRPREMHPASSPRGQRPHRARHIASKCGVESSRLRSSPGTEPVAQFMEHGN